MFHQGTLSLGPAADFALSLRGTVGTASADVIKQSQGRIQIGDVAGQVEGEDLPRPVR